MKIREKLVGAAFACAAALLTHEVLARWHFDQPMDHAEVAMESPVYADNRIVSVGSGSSGPLRINVADKVNATDAAAIVSPIA